MTTSASPAAVDRRTFMRLGASAAGGLLFSLHVVPRLARAAGSPASSDAASSIGFLVRIEKDGTTFIGARSPEIGQGVKTSLPMIIAEEMDADWSKVRVEQLPLGIVKGTDSPFTWKYGHQGAGGSTTIPDAWADLRHAGARVRQVLLAAAAKHWNVPVGDLHTGPGVVKHADGRSIGYGELAPLAATLPLPTDNPPLKDPKQYRIIGTRTRVVDTEDIVTGRARYGLDATLPGALTAVITRCPTFDGELNRSMPRQRRRFPVYATSSRCPARNTASRSQQTWLPASR